MTMVEFTGSYYSKRFLNEVAKLVEPPQLFDKGYLLRVDGTGNDNLPQKIFRVTLASADSYRIIPGTEGDSRMQTVELTDAEIDHKISRRFEAMDIMARATILGVNNALIISGPAGLGKSFGVERELDTAAFNDDIVSEVIKGYIRPTGLYKALYNMRAPGSVLVFDDADSVLLDDVSLNLLKGALDTTEERWISWRSEAKLEDDEGEKIPNKFLFEGQIIFITNLDFEAMIDKGAKIAPHLEALLSRSHYIDLDIKTTREYIRRIRQVCSHGMLSKKGLNAEQENEVLEFMERHADNLRELSLRMALKLATMLKMDPANWQSLAELTVLKTNRKR